MKFILSLLIVTTILSADTCFKLSVGNAALTPQKLCTPSNNLTPPAPLQFLPPALPISTVPTIQCSLPTIAPPPSISVSKCTSAPVICPPPTTPVIACPKSPVPPSCNPCPTPSATPEPASYALVGVGLMTAGIARKFRKKS